PELHGLCANICSSRCRRNPPTKSRISNQRWLGREQALRRRRTAQADAGRTRRRNLTRRFGRHNSDIGGFDQGTKNEGCGCENDPGITVASPTRPRLSHDREVFYPARRAGVFKKWFAKIRAGLPRAIRLLFRPNNASKKTLDCLNTV